MHNNIWAEYFVLFNIKFIPLFFCPHFRFFPVNNFHQEIYLFNTAVLSDKICFEKSSVSSLPYLYFIIIYGIMEIRRVAIPPLYYNTAKGVSINFRFCSPARIWRKFHIIINSLPARTRKHFQQVIRNRRQVHLDYPVARIENRGAKATQLMPEERKRLN